MKNVPNLRFKEFSGEWKNQKLGKLTKLTDGVHFTPTYVESGVPFWSVETVVSNVKPKYITQEAHNEAIKRCYPQYGDILLTRIGTLAIPKLVDWNEPFSIYVSLALIKSSSKFNSKFCKYYLETEYYRKDFLSKSLLTATPQKINMEDLKHTKLSLPSQKEQEKIASFFSLIDKKIELQTKKVEELKNYKKGIMQKIFSQELRFKDENGNEYPEWEEVSLHQIGGTYTGLSGKTKADFGFGHGRFVTYINVFNNTLAKQVAEQVNVSEKENQSLVLKGDLLFTTSSETPNEVGMVSCWNYEMQNLYLNSFCFGYRIHNQDSYLPIFLAYMLRSGEYRKKISILAQGSTRYNISKTELMKMKVQCPVVEEQQKIVSLLLGLESKLEHEQSKLNEFIHYKKGLLQQMFV